MKSLPKGAPLLLLALVQACAQLAPAVSPSPQQTARRSSELEVPASATVLHFSSDHSELTGHGCTEVVLAVTQAQLERLVYEARREGYSALPAAETISARGAPALPRAGWYRLTRNGYSSVAIDTERRQLLTKDCLY
jgi:hypothetical protein